MEKDELRFFYFDTETTGFEPASCLLLTTQFQQISGEGEPLGELIIHKSWETSEKDIVEKVHHAIFSRNKWNFIFVGFNLIFDLRFLFGKFKQYGLKAPELSEFIYDHPIFDIKPFAIMLNNMKFFGSTLSSCTEKSCEGKEVPAWFVRKEYQKIEDYIKMETEAFLKTFRIWKKNIHKLKEQEKKE